MQPLAPRLASFASTRPRLSANCQLAPRRAPIVVACPPVINCLDSPHVGRHLSANPTSDANCSLLLHVWRHLPHVERQLSARPTSGANCNLLLYVGRHTMVNNMFYPVKYPWVVKWVRAIWFVLFKIIKMCGLSEGVGYLRVRAICAKIRYYYYRGINNKVLFRNGVLNCSVPQRKMASICNMAAVDFIYFISSIKYHFS
jgi:hypothetical protein